MDPCGTPECIVAQSDTFPPPTIACFLPTLEKSNSTNTVKSPMSLADKMSSTMQVRADIQLNPGRKPDWNVGLRGTTQDKEENATKRKLLETAYNAATQSSIISPSLGIKNVWLFNAVTSIRLISLVIKCVALQNPTPDEFHEKNKEDK
ncbi:hypothetical protein Trydic_g14741 [Trypoxylus dichotomus]